MLSFAGLSFASLTDEEQQPKKKADLNRLAALAVPSPRMQRKLVSTASTEAVGAAPGTAAAPDASGDLTVAADPSPRPGARSPMLFAEWDKTGPRPMEPGRSEPVGAMIAPRSPREQVIHSARAEMQHSSATPTALSPYRMHTFSKDHPRLVHTARPTLSTVRPRHGAASKPGTSTSAGDGAGSTDAGSAPSPVAEGLGSGAGPSTVSMVSASSSGTGGSSHPGPLPLLPSGSARIIYHGSAALDGWHLRTSKERDAKAIAETKSYYDTFKPNDPLAPLNRMIVLHNRKRAMQMEYRQEMIELDNRLLQERVRESPSSLPPPNLKAREVHARQLNNAIEARNRRFKAIQRENQGMRQRLKKQPPAVDTELKCGFGHDKNLERSSMYPVILDRHDEVAEPPLEQPPWESHLLHRKGVYLK